MEEPLCFVRDNPFFKADGGCKRLVRRAPVALRPQQSPASAMEKKLEMDVVETFIEMGTPTSPSDLEYGPGIVEKLKAKFSRLSGLTSKEPAKRRSPSLDELSSHHDYEPVRATEQMLRRHSKSSSDVLAEDARSYTVHRHIRMEPEEVYFDETPSINTLRRKFETSERSRSLSRSRPVSADFTSHYYNLSAYEPRTIRLESVEIPTGVVSPPTVMSPGLTSPIQETVHREMVIESPAPVPVAPVEANHYQPPAPMREPPPPQREIGEGVRKLRVLEVLNHADNEPEFVKIARSLRKSTAPPADLFESLPEESQVLRRSEIVQAVLEPKKTEYQQDAILRQYEAPVPTTKTEDYKAPEQPKTPVPRKFVIRGEAHLPTLSSNFKIIREIPSNFTDLPPDPQPMQRNSIERRVTSPVQGRAPLAPAQGSPPPEEPRPSKVPEVNRNEEPCRVYEDKGKETVKEEGFSEIQRLLSRFQLSRNTRGSNEVNPVEEVLSPTYAPPQPPSNPPPYDVRPQFSATVVGVNNSARQATYGRVNVVSISVRSDAPSVISNNSNSPDVSPISTAVTANKRPAPSPPDVSPTPQPQPVAQPASQPFSLDERKSLSSVYFDEKARREKPYGDDVTELRTDIRESSVDDTDDEEHMIPTIIEAQPPVQDSEESTASEESTEESENDDLYYPPRPFSLNFPEPMIAGDGNPVRHTLLSLVMEEDIPQLLEAMNERYNFVFEDLHHAEPSTSSIIHPMETRKQRRIQRQVTSIKFQEENPVVYAYLDEDTQTSEQWKDGAFLSYDQYQKIWEEAAEDAAMGIAELERWKAEVTRRLVEHEEQLTEQQISSSSHFADSNTICSRTPAVA